MSDQLDKLLDSELIKVRKLQAKIKNGCSSDEFMSDFLEIIQNDDIDKLLAENKRNHYTKKGTD